MSNVVYEIIDTIVDYIVFAVLVTAGITLGALFIWDALEGAAVVPNYALLRGYGMYSNYQVAIQMLAGQVSILCGVGGMVLIWLDRRKKNRT